MLDASDVKTAKLPKKKSSRIYELDAIRALSCLNLLLFHFTYVYQNKYGFESPLGFAFPYGKYGVQLFFMLSGLVNAMTLLSKRKTSDFLVARCIRIFPSYWLVIALNVLLFAMIPMFNHPVSVNETIANATTMPMLLGYENMEPVTWTLQVEMLFYLFLMGIFAIGLLDKPIRTMLVAVSLCLVAGLSINFFKDAYPNSVWNGRLYAFEQLFFIRNMPLFAMGILLNELRCKRGNPYGLWAGILAAATVFHLIDLRDHNPVATALMFGLLTASAFGRVPILRWKPLVYISFISYSLYLFHNNLGSALIKQLEIFGVPPLAGIIIATAFAIGVSHAITFWLEQPLTKWMRTKYSNSKEWFANRKKDYRQQVDAVQTTVSRVTNKQQTET
jgi:peptidoglycan/LPS O-acetylase OafA/YrhL